MSDRRAWVAACLVGSLLAVVLDAPDPPRAGAPAGGAAAPVVADRAGRREVSSGAGRGRAHQAPVLRRPDRTRSAGGILVTIPAHAGPATLLFDLHNRHTYSEEAVKSGRGYHRFTASIGVLTLDNTLISRAVDAE